jgi:O-antigen/teichoic acid export membrane protein
LSSTNARRVRNRRVLFWASSRFDRSKLDLSMDTTDVPPASSNPNLEPNRPELTSLEPSSIGRDVSAQVLAQLLAHILIGISVVLLVRHFSPHDNGLLNVAWGLTHLATFLTDLGLNISLVRSASSAGPERRRDLIWTSFRLRASLVLAVIALGFIASFVLPIDPELRVLLRVLVLPMTVVNMLLNWVDAVMVACERIALSARFTFVWNVAHVGATILTPIMHGSLVTYALLHTALTSSVSVLGLIWVWRAHRYSPRHDRGVLEGLAAFGFGDFLTNIVDYIPSFTLVPPVMSFASHGAFGAGEKIPRSLFFLPFGLGKAFFTRMCQAWPTESELKQPDQTGLDHDGLEDRIERHDSLVLGSIRVGAIIGGVFGIGLFVTAPELIQFLWPDKWPPETAVTLAIIGFVPFVKTIGFPLLNALASSRRYALRARVLGIYAISAVIAFMTLPRAYGVTGAALAALVSELALLVTTLLLTRAALRSRVIGLGSRFVLPIIAGVALALLVKPIWQPNIHPLFDACLPAALGALIFLGGFVILDAESRGALRQFWIRQRKLEP